MFFILTLTLNFIAMYYLYRQWKGNNNHKFSRTLSLVLVIASVIFWILMSGPEFGIVYWASFSALSSWFIIYCSRTIKKKHSKLTSGKSPSPLSTDLSFESLFHSISYYSRGTLKLVFILSSSFLFSACICFLPPLVANNYSSNILVLSLYIFLIIWPVSILECHRIINQPKKIMIFSSFSIVMFISVLGAKLL